MSKILRTRSILCKIILAEVKERNKGKIKIANDKTAINSMQKLFFPIQTKKGEISIKTYSKCQKPFNLNAC